jgi:hypothetical protein
MALTIMNTQTDKSDSLVPTIAVIAVMLFGIVGIARIAGWLPNSMFDFSNVPSIEVLSKAAVDSMASDDRPYAPSDAPSKARCPECGVIVSMREIGVNVPSVGHDAVSQTLANAGAEPGESGARGYEFSVRLSGGARRVIIAPNRARWRVGERVIIIDGINASQP